MWVLFYCTSLLFIWAWDRDEAHSFHMIIKNVDYLINDSSSIFSHLLKPRWNLQNCLFISSVNSCNLLFSARINSPKSLICVKLKTKDFLLVSWLSEPKDHSTSERFMCFLQSDWKNLKCTKNYRTSSWPLSHFLYMKCQRAQRSGQKGRYGYITPVDDWYKGLSPM